jgi:hypothetical protein
MGCLHWIFIGLCEYNIIVESNLSKAEKNVTMRYVRKKKEV